MCAWPRSSGSCREGGLRIDRLVDNHLTILFDGLSAPRAPSDGRAREEAIDGHARLADRLIAIVIPGFGAAPAPSWNGYVEADYVYVAAASAGHDRDDRGAARATRSRRATCCSCSRQDQQQALLRGGRGAGGGGARRTLENLTTGSRERRDRRDPRQRCRRREADLSLAQRDARRAARSCSPRG